MSIGYPLSARNLVKGTGMDILKLKPIERLDLTPAVLWWEL